MVKKLQITKLRIKCINLTEDAEHFAFVVIVKAFAKIILFALMLLNVT